ncbi:MAG: protein translocase subunit SecF [Pseudomonadota bacterium]
MISFRLVPDQTSVPFLRYRKLAFVLSGILMVLSAVLLPVKGLNFGIDFRGGTMIEVRMPGDAADLAGMRSILGGLNLGEVALQEFGAPTDVLIRIERQEGGQDVQLAAVDQIKAALGENYGDDLSYRRVEFVGPKVSGELLWAGTQAVLYALIAVLIYIWFRFEWQFGIGAVVALVHDVLLTLGVFSLVGLEFNLATVAAILTIVGYSLNDTVVVYDRVRENLRRYKALAMLDLLDRSLNETLARTLMTSVTTLIALTTLFVLGGPVIRDFTFAMIWGVLVGTYSSMFIATPLLLQLHVRRPSGEEAVQTP